MNSHATDSCYLHEIFVISLIISTANDATPLYLKAESSEHITDYRNRVNMVPSALVYVFVFHVCSLPPSFLIRLRKKRNAPEIPMLSFSLYFYHAIIMTQSLVKLNFNTLCTTTRCSKTKTTIQDQDHVLL